MNKEKQLNIISPLLIVLAALIWGISFVAQSEGGEIGSFTFQSVRCTLAFISVGIVTLITNNTGKAKLNKKKYNGIKDWASQNKTFIKCGIICGISLGIANNLQQFGIEMQGKETSTGRAAFLTALYIIIVPVFGIFFKKKIHLLSWCSVLVAIGGLYLISVQPGSGLSISTADILLILCAVFFGTQIFTVDYFNGQVDGLKLSCFQVFIAAIISYICMFMFEKPDINAIMGQAVPLIYSGVFSGGAAFTLQILGQKRCNPVLASLLMSLESVFSALADWIIRGNTMNPRELMGCGVMFIAILLAQAPDFLKSRKNNV